VNPDVSLALRQARGGSLPAEALAERLYRRPEEIVAAVEDLGRLGFRIESHPLQGFRLLEAPPALIADEIAWNLGTTRVGRRVRCVGETPSTNDLAWQAVREGRDAADGLAIFAEHQTAGRGRRGNRWLAPLHSSILCSVVLWGPHGAPRAGVLTRAASLAAADAIDAETGLGVGIRWPNDLVVDDRKVGGIMVEARPNRSESGPVVLGIGINCTQGPEAFPARMRGGVTSLAAAGADVDRTLLSRGLLERLDRVTGRMGEAIGAEAVREAVARRCRTLGRRITVSEGPEVTSGEVVALDPDYGLLLRLPTGEIRRFPAMTTHVVRQIPG